jgi:hypothetical protein
MRQIIRFWVPTQRVLAELEVRIMLKSRTHLCLLLAVVLLAVMVVPLMGAAGSLAAVESNTIQAHVFTGQPAAVIACIPGDPGTSGGGCGGG